MLESRIIITTTECILVRSMSHLRQRLATLTSDHSDARQSPKCDTAWRTSHRGLSYGRATHFSNRALCDARQNRRCDIGLRSWLFTRRASLLHQSNFTWTV